MTIRERHGDRANRLTTRALLSIGEELREARLQAGLTIRALATSTGISPAQISRIEHGALRHVAYETIVALAAALGMDVPLRAYPSGEPIRDAAQLALLARFRARLPSELRHRSEVPLGIPGDRRAWDEVILGPGWSLPVEAETRLRDVQALHRRFALNAGTAARSGRSCSWPIPATTVTSFGSRQRSSETRFPFPATSRWRLWIAARCLRGAP